MCSAKNHRHERHDRLPVPIPRVECVHSPCNNSTCQRCHCMLCTRQCLQYLQCLPILEAWKAKPRSNPNGNRQVVQVVPKCAKGNSKHSTEKASQGPLSPASPVSPFFPPFPSFLSPPFPPFPSLLLLLRRSSFFFFLLLFFPLLFVLSAILHQSPWHPRKDRWCMTWTKNINRLVLPKFTFLYWSKFLSLSMIAAKQTARKLLVYDWR